jgi:hypothetical protein
VHDIVSSTVRGGGKLIIPTVLIIVEAVPGSQVHQNAESFALGNVSSHNPLRQGLEFAYVIEAYNPSPSSSRESCVIINADDMTGYAMFVDVNGMHKAFQDVL